MGGRKNPISGQHKLCVWPAWGIFSLTPPSPTASTSAHNPISICQHVFLSLPLQPKLFSYCLTHAKIRHLSPVLPSPTCGCGRTLNDHIFPQCENERSEIAKWAEWRWVEGMKEGDDRIAQACVEASFTLSIKRSSSQREVMVTIKFVCEKHSRWDNVSSAQSGVGRRLPQ